MVASLSYLFVLYVALFWKALDAWRAFRSRPRKETFSFKIGDIWAAGLCVTPVLVFGAKIIESELIRSVPSERVIWNAVMMMLIIVPCQCVGIFARMVTEEIGPTVGRANSLISAATVLVGAFFGIAMTALCFWYWFDRIMTFIERMNPERQRSRWRNERRRAKSKKESPTDAEES
jgi:hypothetical protein